MNFRSSGKLLIASGILCFAAAFLLLSAFRGEFGKDTAGQQFDMPDMEDTIDVTPDAQAPASSGTQRLAAAPPGAPAASWIVYVTGAVRNPGVYEVAPSSRIYVALKAAGGFTPDADQEMVNLAAPLQDGAHIIFPRKGGTARPAPAAPPAAAQAPSSGAPARRVPVSGRVNINTATLSELDSLKGIGPKTAEAIISYRESNGIFRRAEDLMEVKGIGPKKFDAIKDKITIGY